MDPFETPPSRLCAPGATIALAVMLLVAAGCQATSTTTTTAADPPTPAGTDTTPVAAIDCELDPVTPVITVEGETGFVEYVVAAGPVTTATEDGQLVISVDDPARPMTFTVGNAGLDDIGVTDGESATVEFWYRQGFEGAAQGLKVTDAQGLALLVEDGDYGNAIQGEDLAPFVIGQHDAGCRNRANHPGELNNFVLTITTDAATVDVLPGASTAIEVDGQQYTVTSLRSTSRHSDVIWTDAPYDHTSFVIVRSPS